MYRKNNYVAPSISVYDLSYETDVLDVILGSSMIDPDCLGEDPLYWEGMGD